MPQPAARVTDMHVCPMVTPGLPPVPHVGGPVCTHWGITGSDSGEPGTLYRGSGRRHYGQF